MFSVRAGSSPVKPSTRPAASHKRQDVEESTVKPNKKEITLKGFLRRIGHTKYKSPGEVEVPDGIGTSAEIFANYANEISGKVHKKSRNGTGPLLVFHEEGKNASAKDHTSGTQCRPDVIVSLEGNYGEGIDRRWPCFESVIEVHSQGKPLEARIDQAISSTSYLLQARPDRFSVTGLYVDHRGVIFIMADTECFSYTPLLPWDDDDLCKHLAAFIDALYSPPENMVDPGITRKVPDHDKQCVWDLTFTSIRPVEAKAASSKRTTVVCEGYELDYSSKPIGRRTYVFSKSEDIASINNRLVPVIKVQYHREDRRFEEMEIITHIHSEGLMPGVVTVVHGEILESSSGKAVVIHGRNRVMLALGQYGTPFMDIKTPREALMTIYDLLEITRCLYSQREVLHRDISTGNIVINLHVDTLEPQKTKNEEPGHIVENPNRDGAAQPLKGPVFSSYLLDKSSHPKATNTLLIDLDCGDILTMKRRVAPVVRTGTFHFMARALHHKGPLPYDNDEPFTFRRLPEPPARYREIFGDRITRFQANNRITVDPATIDDSFLPPFRHALRHDAESIFLLLLFWAIHIQPQDQSSAPSIIPGHTWDAFESPRYDVRRLLFSYEENTHIDAAYGELFPLFQDMGKYFLHDYHWAPEGTLTQPDYVHEALQRLILNFLDLNSNAAFLDLEVADHHRQIEPRNTWPALTGPERRLTNRSVFESSHHSGIDEGAERRLTNTSGKFSRVHSEIDEVEIDDENDADIPRRKRART